MAGFWYPHRWAEIASASSIKGEVDDHGQFETGVFSPEVTALIEDNNRALEDYLNGARSQFFSLPGTASTQTGNCPARYADVVDGGIGTLLGAGTTPTVFTIVILDHAGVTHAKFTHTVGANVLINARAPTIGKKIGPLVIDSDLINVSVVYGTGAHDGLFELRYL